MASLTPATDLSHPTVNGLAVTGLPSTPCAKLSSISPSDSVSQVRARQRNLRQKSSQSAVYDDDDLTDPGLSEDENILRKFFSYYILCY